ncbi:MAG: division/cell wall cluster transcriptional repressor MraZ [Proteobacteria bacterium]|nr:division/cell wall cluster transcriptional repressor MraZ [Pseudomonadota bacterium]
MDSDLQFEETSFHQTDDKARIILPNRFREVIAATGYNKIVVSRLDGCLVAYPVQKWKQIVARMMEKPRSNARARRFRRFYIGAAQTCEIDRQGRILISAALREYAGIEPKSPVAMAGVTTHFEIWSKSQYEQEYLSFREEEDAGDLGDEIEELGT